jgi:Protein of unknown function (DUF1592)/Protein of unknown function (DUF1588)/Protein of unknown function (DUF1587)/Protein of unknown function (DUF1585)/Protein of unknown function (DUF1595)
MTRKSQPLVAPGQRRRQFPVFAALLFGMASCVGSIGAVEAPQEDNDPGGGGGGDNTPNGNPNSPNPLTGGSNSNNNTPPPPVVTPGVEPAVCTDYATGPVFHRLNRTEFQNSVNALLGTNLPLRDDLPADDLVDGFDNSADVTVSATLMQKYLSAAEKAATAALADAALAGKLGGCDVNAADCTKKVLTSLLPRAFRRPVTETEIADYTKYATVCKSSAKAGLSCALQAVLVSPKFLYRAELIGPEAQDAACGVSRPLTSVTRTDLSPHALASRLAYFITSSGPDAQLLDLATKGRLSDPAVIASEVERLLAPAVSDRFARPFIESLPAQWLQIDKVKVAAPAPNLFPGFDEPLRQAMEQEAKLFFAELVRSNRSALELLRADFTFLNERLAKHYGITGVTGSEMRKVDTRGSARGGILTQASFLTATSSSENTSIVHRAKWVLNNVLCEHIPDPPENVDTTALPAGAEGLTNRESLEMRTANQPCAGCHAMLNPIGFGLEVFDAIGTSRTKQNNRTIDPSGTLPGAGSFKDADEMMALLKKDPRVPMCLTKKLLTYALGRSIAAKCDQEAVKALVDAFAKDDYRLKNHIVRIAQSELFRTAQRR